MLFSLKSFLQVFFRYLGYIMVSATCFRFSIHCCGKINVIFLSTLIVVLLAIFMKAIHRILNVIIGMIIREEVDPVLTKVIM